MRLINCYVDGLSCAHKTVLDSAIKSVHCNLRLLLAQINVERVKRGEVALSLRQLASESGVSLSVLTALNTNKSEWIDYRTINKLLRFFNKYIAVNVGDLLIWTPEENEAV